MKHQLIHWLREAYAMERQSIEVLERQQDLARGDVILMKRLGFHLIETRDQAEKLRLCLENLGSHAEGIRMGLSRLVGNMHAISAAVGADDKVKSIIINAIFEKFEIGCYEALIVAAEEADEPEVAELCRDLQAQERTMERWLDDHLQSVAHEFLRMRNIAALTRHAQHAAQQGRA
ncbi:MAG TPA: DUF892 family protein [Alphaproteobacteria bacterium]